ncbi:MAG: aminotransferase class I/II-fold pyridoxal phosphate-dependent enzyme [Roseivirga sp.]
MQTADRLGQVQEYYFSKKLREIAELRAAGKPVLNLGIGSPDLSPPQEVIDELIKVAPGDVHQYQSYQGIPELRSAIAGFYQKHYAVKLDETSGILPLMGSKEGITHISLAFLNKGDQVLIPELGYPTYTSVTKMVEAEPVYFPLLENNGWEPDWGFLEAQDYSRIKIIWINYPHMPTGTRGTREILKRFVKLAREKNVLLVNDNPYSFILNDEPTSLLAIPGAEEVALELNSLSKTFNMAGWRIGWVCGNPELISQVLRIKSNMDSGMFKPLQLAAVKALQLGTDWYHQLNATYRQRRTLACELLSNLGCTWKDDQSGLFIWAKVKQSHVDELVDWLLYEKDLFITPGHIFGERGKQYLRISLCVNEAMYQEALNRLEKQ